MTNKRLQAYLQDHVHEWEDCLSKLQDQIGLSEQSFKIQKPFMLIIDDRTPGYIAIEYLREYSCFSEDSAKTNEIIKLKDNIRNEFELFNDNLADEIRWRKLGHIDQPYIADIYCPPSNEITNKKYGAKSYEIDEENITRSLDQHFEPTSIFSLILCSLPALIMRTFTFGFSLRRNLPPIPGEKDKKWLLYLRKGAPGTSPFPTPGPDTLNGIVSSIFTLYDYHNITLTEDEKSTITEHWKNKEFWPKKLDRKLQAMGNQPPKRTHGSINFIDWIDTVNHTFKKGLTKNDKNSILNYMLCTLLLPVLTAQELLSLQLVGIGNTYLIGYFTIRLPRNIEEAEFISNGIENSSDLELQRHLLSLILSTKNVFPELEEFQLELISRINPEILNLTINNSSNIYKKGHEYQLAEQLTNTTNRKVLLGIIAYGSGHLVKLANQKLKVIEGNNK